MGRRGDGRQRVRRGVIFGRGITEDEIVETVRSDPRIGIWTKEEGEGRGSLDCL